MCPVFPRSQTAEIPLPQFQRKHWVGLPHESLNIRHWSQTHCQKWLCCSRRKSRLENPRQKVAKPAKSGNGTLGRTVNTNIPIVCQWFQPWLQISASLFSRFVLFKKQKNTFAASSHDQLQPRTGFRPSLGRARRRAPARLTRRPPCRRRAVR